MNSLTAQFHSWKLFLNNKIGTLSFVLALTSLGTDNPQLYATLSMVFVAFIRFGPQGRSILKDLNDYRKLAKNNPCFQHNVDVIVSSYLSYEILWRDYKPFLFGYLFLFWVIFYPEIVTIFSLY